VSKKKHVFELDELDSIAQELESISTISEQDRTRLQKISDELKQISDTIFVSYKKYLRSE
jgi:hypothetical protein